MQKSWRNAAYRLAQLAFFHNLQPARYHTKLAGLSCINHSSRKCPAAILTGWSNGGISSPEAPSSWVALVCVKLTKTTQQRGYDEHPRELLTSGWTAMVLLTLSNAGTMTHSNIHFTWSLSIVLQSPVTK